MECQSSDSKKLFKVFDASKRKRSRKKRDGHDDTLSLGTDESNSQVCQANGRVPSQKASLQELSTVQTVNGTQDVLSKRGSSPSVTRSRRPSRSPRRYRERRAIREGASLALKAGLVSTPRSSSPRQGQDCADDTIPHEDSFIYAFLEDAIKRDKKKKQRSSRKREEREESPRERRHHRRHKDEMQSRDRERDKRASRDRTEQRPEETNPVHPVDQTMLFETFAKICAQLNNKCSHYNRNDVPRTQSHKSLQCSVVAPRRDSYDVDRHPVRLRSNSQTRDAGATRMRGSDFSGRVQSRDKMSNDDPRRHDKCTCHYERDDVKYQSKLELDRSRMRNLEEERYIEYPTEVVPTRTSIDPYRRPPENREYREFEREMRMRHYEDDRRKYCEQTTSRSFDVNREPYEDGCRRTARSDLADQKRYDMSRDRFEQAKYYDKNMSRERVSKIPSRDRRLKKNMDRLERTSMASREDDYRERDRYSERERDSGLSVADGETSTVSGRSNCLKAVKQEIIEQREAMDKMMKLWKELMRCFKGITQTEGQDKTIRDSAANARDSAAAQLRLWRECMHRYETVARDVGDTDARLMEEIKKQRSEMAEMANMWQECLQRYRDISNDFNNLKQQLAPPESPTRASLPGPPLVCAEGEGSMPPLPYRHAMSSHYPQMGAVGCNNGSYGYGESPARGRAPPWMWCREPAPRSPRRRSSPDSHGSRDRRRRHKDRDDSRYKEKSKPSVARSEHKHRKR